MTTTDVGRLVLSHPDLGTTGGAGLHAAITAIYKKIGDNVATRILVNLSVANGANADFEHDFKAALSELRYDLYIASSTDPYDLTRITATSSPSLSQFTVVATPSFLTTKIRVTNNSGSTQNLALVVFMDPLKFSEGDVQDVDVSTTAPQDGQALVYDAATSKWKPGASGDASFKLQDVTTPTLTLKGGYLLDPYSGIEYATYDGSGTDDTDYGKDLSLNLTTILGGSPANATYYNLVIDKTTLSTATIVTSGRRLVAVQQANFKLLTGALSSVDLTRYLLVGYIHSATTGTVWSGTGAAFGTFATRTVNPLLTAKYNKFVHPTLVGINIYATITAAIAAASAGDRILVMAGYTITAAETINVANILVDFLPNVQITINAAVKGLIISSNDVELNRPSYISAFAGTIPAGVEVTGNNCMIDKGRVESNNAGTTITAAYNITGVRNRVVGCSIPTLGTITDSVTDSGTSSDFNVRG